MIRLYKPPTLVRNYYSGRMWRFSSSAIYLTFDDGPTALTEWILSVLKEKGVKATFFCVGQNAKDHPELMEKIMAEGHAIGNHTMRHEKGGKVSREEYIASVKEASQYIRSNLFRPPYGKMPKSYEKKLSNDYTIVMWSWLSYDFDPEVSVSSILKRAPKEIKPGDILVLHDNLKIEDRIKELLPPLLDSLIAKGHSFEVISV